MEARWGGARVEVAAGDIGECAAEGPGRQSGRVPTPGRAQDHLAVHDGRDT